MLETYLFLESIAIEYIEVVVDTKIIKLPSGEPAKLRIELIDGRYAIKSRYADEAFYGVHTEKYIAANGVLTL